MGRSQRGLIDAALHQADSRVLMDRASEWLERVARVPTRADPTMPHWSLFINDRDVHNAGVWGDETPLRLGETHLGALSVTPLAPNLCTDPVKGAPRLQMLRDNLDAVIGHEQGHRGRRRARARRGCRGDRGPVRRRVRPTARHRSPGSRPHCRGRSRVTR